MELRTDLELYDERTRDLAALVAQLRLVHSDIQHKYFTFSRREYTGGNGLCIIRKMSYDESRELVRKIGDAAKEYFAKDGGDSDAKENFAQFVLVALQNFARMDEFAGPEGELQWVSMTDQKLDHDVVAVAKKDFVTDAVDNMIQGTSMMCAKLFKPLPVVPSPPPQTDDEISNCLIDREIPVDVEMAE